ncbi:MAG TPA: 1,4-alpha-glucan branching protein GlgB [Ferruginibacter sp.]|nr:1,4-alpha-glucan branching protein GlgB [Ferruginibacter sp.]
MATTKRQPVNRTRKQASPAPSPSTHKYEEAHFIDSQKPVWNYSLFTDEDIVNFKNGTLYNGYRKFGAHAVTVLNTAGFYFAVWAPNATKVSVVGDFNGWKKQLHPLYVRLDQSGIWEGFIPHIQKGEAYKFFIKGYKGVELMKADPYARYAELRPATSSISWHSEYQWTDAAWMKKRKKHNALTAPWSVYEVHLGSWQRPVPTDEESFNTYAQLIEHLVPYVKHMGFTHVELMPVMEFPFDGSWGYQGTGYFSPTSRFGTPDEFKQLINAFHQQDIGVILDWVPSHFPYDAHGLFMFDGTHTYEYADMRKGYHQDWNSYIFNYRRSEVRSFLVSSARYWLDEFHVDGLRVDAVNSILRLDYSRKEGEWEPNEFGGNGNLEAIEFVKQFNETVYRDFPDIQTIAEEASDWPQVSHPTTQGGLGFGMKWMMGWMHDTLDYFKMDPLMRQFHQNKFSFSMMYYYDENFMLPFSHDEVVHGKSPMIYKMPGDEWQKFANLRLLYTYMYTHPGAKLLFMGNEFAQTSEWNYKTELDWPLLQFDCHKLMQECVKDLNLLYQECPALHKLQFDPKGFEWVDLNHRQESVVAYMRKAKNRKDDILVVLNMTPVVRHDWKFRVKGKAAWKEIFNSDSKGYWGTGKVYNPSPKVKLVDKKAGIYEINLHLPALGGVIFR